MKKLLFFSALIITLSACGQAQRRSGDESPSLDRFYDHFNADGQANSISLDPGFMLTASFSGKNKSNGNWIQKVTKVRLLILDDKKTTMQRADWNELTQSLQQDRFEELLSIRKGSDRVQLLSKERRDGDKEIVFWAGGKDGGGLLLHFRGPFTEKDMEEMQSAVRDNQNKD